MRLTGSYWTPTPITAAWAAGTALTKARVPSPRCSRAATPGVNPPPWIGRGLDGRAEVSGDDPSDRFGVLMTKEGDGTIVLDPHVNGAGVLRFDADAATSVRDVFTEWLG